MCVAEDESTGGRRKRGTAIKVYNMKPIPKPILPKTNIVPVI